jgi:hypothetical protein
VVSVVDPETPVTVTVYVPAVVPELPEPPPLLLPPPQLDRPPVKNARRISIPSMVRHLRRRAGMPKSITQAKVAPPDAYHGTETPPALGWARWLSAVLVAAVVVIVSVEVCAVAPEMVTEVGERLHIAGSLAAVGLTAQLRLTTPLNPFDPVVLIVDVLLVVAPGLRVMFPLLVRAKPGCGGAAVTVTSTIAFSVTLPRVPVIATT